MELINYVNLKYFDSHKTLLKKLCVGKFYFAGNQFKQRIHCEELLIHNKTEKNLPFTAGASIDQTRFFFIHFSQRNPIIVKITNAKSKSYLHFLTRT